MTLCRDLLIGGDGYGVNEHFTRVAYVGLLNDDDTLKLLVPLYVKVSGDVSPEQQKLTNEIVAELVRKYQKQISQHLTNLKREQMENERKNND